MRRRVQKLEFYITNVCNLACPDCNRFNDHDFRGHQRWQDYEKDYQEWSRKLDSDGLVILGGEPLLNPTICEWIVGISQSWQKGVQTLTNGTRLNRTPHLYDALSSFHDGLWRNWVGISVHNINDIDRYLQEAQKFLKEPIQQYLGRTARDERGEFVSFGADYTFIDKNDVAVRLWVQDKFIPAAVHRKSPQYVDGQWQPGSLTVYNNDPELAHEACGFAHWKNYHMIKGRLHKCGPCVLLAEFDQQNPLDITPEDRQIMQSYRSLSPWDDDKTTHRFFKHLDDVIPQCKFCPTQEQMYNKTIQARLKKKGSTGTFG